MCQNSPARLLLPPNSRSHALDRSTVVRVPMPSDAGAVVGRSVRATGGVTVADETGHWPRGPARILKATIWSLQGLRAAWLHESSFRLEVCLLAVLAPLALWLGDTGVERALQILKEEIERGMRLVGVANVEQLNRDRLRFR